MAVKIRLKRMGTNKKPFYRIVIADSRMPRDGRFIEEIGFYDPLQSPPRIVLQEDRASFWIQKGAQPSDTVKRFLVGLGVIDRKIKVREKVRDEGAKSLGA